MTDRSNLSSVFISHVKILFDILDENRTGFVKLSDIESHWDGNDCVIPRNIVIQSLSNVASSAGRLSFDTLITGLERALVLWKSNGCGNIASSTKKEESCSTNVPNGTTSVQSLSSENSNNFDSAGQQRRVQKSSAACNGPLKFKSAEYDGGPVTLDGPNVRHIGRIPGEHNVEYAYVQKRKGISLFNSYLLLLPCLLWIVETII